MLIMKAFLLKHDFQYRIVSGIASLMGVAHRRGFRQHEKKPLPGTVLHPAPTTAAINAFRRWSLSPAKRKQVATRMREGKRICNTYERLGALRKPSPNCKIRGANQSPRVSSRGRVTD